ncbi:MAG: SPFH domain-containing protein [Holophagales bacterium]|jgi:membrane protease subunit (stomatin/prohibitin family)|nr:SPFH domain-containing protein [Holophagales bacterium]
MSILGWGKAQFLDVIEWLDDSNDTMAWRFPMRGQEIQNGGKLVVRESQEAVFVNEGQFADCFRPGTHTLNTKNLPILATLKGWKYGFESPFKSDVYFLNTKLFNDLGWGTPNPIMMRDADFGMLRVRAFGIYSIRVVDSKNFLKNVVGTSGLFTVADIQDQLRKSIVTRFADALGEARIPALDLAAQYNDLSDLLRQKMDPEFQTMGLECAKFFIENISLPPEVEAMLDKRTNVGIMAPVMGAFTQMQVAESIPKAAENPGGLAGAGMGLGVGLGIGNIVAGQLGQAIGAQQQGAQQTQQTQQIPQAPAKSLKEELTDLKDLFDSQLITQAEFDAQRQAIMQKHGMGV